MTIIILTSKYDELEYPPPQFIYLTDNCCYSAQEDESDISYPSGATPHYIPIPWNCDE